MHQAEMSAPPPDLLVTGHYRVAPPYAIYRPCGSGNWLITYTLDGHGIYRHLGAELPTGPGDIVLLQPHAVHDYRSAPGSTWEFLWAHFHPLPSWRAWWHVAEDSQGLIVLPVEQPEARARIHRAFLQLHEDARAIDIQALRDADREPSSAGMAYERRRLQHELALNGLEQVLLVALRDSERQHTRRLDERVQRVLDLMAGDLAAPHSLESLAGVVALSPSRLGHLFRSEVGESVGTTLLSLRLQQAARLLEHTSRSIGLIAAEVGFHSSFYFSRQFRRRYGVSSRDYRRLVS